MCCPSLGKDGRRPPALEQSKSVRDRARRRLTPTTEGARVRGGIVNRLFKNTGLAVLPFLLAACDNGEPTSRPKVEVVTGHASPAAGSFEAVGFKCCDVPAAKNVVDSFVALGVALAADDLPASTEAAQAFAKVLETDGAALAGDAEIVGKLGGLSGRMTGHSDLADIREDFLDASTEVMALARAHTADVGTAYAVAFCPMKPGRWLQTAPPLANPYYGSQMLRCGTFEGLSPAE